MEICQSNSGSGTGFGKFLFWTGLIVVLLGIAYCICEHALAKHGQDAVMVDNCIEQKGPVLGRWIRSSDGRIALPCEVNDNLYGIRIDAPDGSNVTAILKNKMKCAFMIIRYLINTGYEPADNAAWNWYNENPIPCQ